MRNGQALFQIVESEVREVRAGEHAGTPTGERHEPGSGILEEFAPGESGEVAREFDLAARVAQDIRDALRLR